ncbi:MAG: hypothetical protein WAM44_04660 [Chthoniobacterales bacterium]
MKDFVSKRQRRISANIRRLKKRLAQIQQTQADEITPSPRNLSRHTHINNSQEVSHV